MEEPILKVSLKDYKKSIDELRASLLSLDSASEEYKATAEEIREKQSKLNEVMAVGKKDVDAVAGSYDALVQQMAALKKEWRGMEMGTEEWQAMAAQINALNDQLKDADALTGNFQRNVGDYANAFGAAFDKAAEQLGRMPGPLGMIFKTTKDLLPAIKAANKTATTGLAGVKKAIVSTGIGALVVAVGLLVAHWGDLMKLVGLSKNTAEDAAKANEELNKKFEEQDFALEQTVRIMEAQGASTIDIIEKKEDLIKSQIKEKTAQIEENRATLKAIGNHTWLGRVLRGEQGDYKKLQEQIQKEEEELDKLAKKQTTLGTDTKVYYENRKKEAEKAYEKERQEAEKLLNQIEENNKTEIQKLTDKYNKELALLKKHHKSTKLLTEQYNKDMLALANKSAKERQEAEDRLFNAQMGGRNQDSKYWNEYLKRYKKQQSELFAKANKAQEEIVANNITDQKKKDAIYQQLGFENEADFIEQGKAAMENVRVTIGKIREETIKENTQGILNEGGILRQGTQSEIKNQLEYLSKLREEYQKAFASGTWDITQDEFGKIMRDNSEEIIATTKELAEYNADYAQFAKNYNNLFGNGKTYNNEIAATKQSLEEYYNVMAQIIELTEWEDNPFDGLEVFSEEWKKAVIDNLDMFPEDARSTFLQKLTEFKDAENLILQERLENWLNVSKGAVDSMFSQAAAYADVMGSIADIMDTSIQQDKKRLIEQGKTEEEANKLLEGRFESMKSFQIAQAVINTIAGAVGAFMGITRDTGGWGWAAAAAEAAAVTAAGIAQIEKIKATSIGNTSSLEGSSVSVTPTLADYSPERTANVTSASDTDNLANALSKQNIYVKVSDIDKAQKKVQVRDNESRF